MCRYEELMYVQILKGLQNAILRGSRMCRFYES